VCSQNMVIGYVCVAEWDWSDMSGLVVGGVDLVVGGGWQILALGIV